MNDLLIQDISINWNKIDEYSYIRQIDAIKNLNHLSFESPVTFFVGENGSGKSTLLEAIAVKLKFNPEGGTRNYNFSTYNSHSELCNAIRITKGVKKPKWGYFLRAESFYNVASYEEIYANSAPGMVSQQLHKKSHGESFLAVAQKHFQSDSLYFLDEPEAALSPQKQLTLLLEIYRYSKKGAQFIVATHSPILLGLPGAKIYSFDSGTIHLCEYEDTESYRVTELFINNRQQLLNQLLDE